MSERRWTILVCNACGKPSDGPLDSPGTCRCPNLANGEHVEVVLPAADYDKALETARLPFTVGQLDSFAAVLDDNRIPLDRHRIADQLRVVRDRLADAVSSTLPEPASGDDE